MKSGSSHFQIILSNPSTVAKKLSQTRLAESLEKQSFFFPEYFGARHRHGQRYPDPSLDRE